MRGYTVYVYVGRAILVSIFLVIFAVPLLAAGPHVLVCYGDSITAGHGLPEGQSFPDALQRQMDAQGYHYKVINQGTSGATTKDAVASLPAVLRLHPEVALVEFGGSPAAVGPRVKGNPWMVQPLIWFTAPFEDIELAN